MNTLAEMIERAQSACNDQPNTREMAMVRTKLEEAMMWFQSHAKGLQRMAKQHGMPTGTPVPQT